MRGNKSEIAKQQHIPCSIITIIIIRRQKIPLKALSWVVKKFDLFEPERDKKYESPNIDRENERESARA